MHATKKTTKACNSFFKVNMASGMDRTCVHPTMKKKMMVSCNMAAILQLTGQLRHAALGYNTQYFFDIGHLLYMYVMVN